MRMGPSNIVISAPNPVLSALAKGGMSADDFKVAPSAPLVLTLIGEAQPK